MPENGPEPTNWELMRGLDKVEAAVAKLADRVVPLDVYAGDKQASGDRFLRLEARTSTLELASVEAEKLKRQQRLTVSLAIASPFMAVLVGVVSRSFGL